MGRAVCRPRRHPRPPNLPPRSRRRAAACRAPIPSSCAFVLLAFPFAATLSASGQPVEVGEEALEPLDGGHVAKGTAGLAAGLAVLAAAVFFLLGLA